MKWSLKIATIAGIKIYIHWTFIFLIAWALVSSLKAGNTMGDALYIIVFIFSVFLCVVLHELGHALVAKKFNYVTRDITLLPIGGMARMDELPENPKQELLIAIAGPAVNFAIAFILWPIIYLTTGVPTVVTIMFNTRSSFLFDMLMINMALGIFNLIPAFPMDGGRVLRALLAMKMTRLRATEIAAHVGQFISIIFFFVGLFYNPILAIIGIFILLTAQAETEYVRSHTVLHKYKVRDIVMHHYFTIDANSTIGDAVKLLLDVQAKNFLVNQGGNVIGILDSNDIIRGLSHNGDKSLVKDAMKVEVKYLTPEMTLEDAYKYMMQHGENIMPVMDNNQLIGIVDMNNILELIMVSEAIDKRNLKNTANTKPLEVAA